MLCTDQEQVNRQAGERQAKSRLTLLDGALAVLVGAASMIPYVRTLHPRLLPGDSGEFQVLARLLGNTHPTGYQVYVVLGHVFARLPVGDVAYRVNLFSAAMGALAIVELYLAGRLLAGRRWPALFAAGALCLSALVFLEEKPYRAGPQQENSMLQYVQAHIPDRTIYSSQCLDELTRAGYRCRLVPTRTIRLYRILPAQ